MARAPLSKEYRHPFNTDLEIGLIEEVDEYKRQNPQTTKRLIHETSLRRFLAEEQKKGAYRPVSAAR